MNFTAARKSADLLDLTRTPLNTAAAPKKS